MEEKKRRIGGFWGLVLVGLGVTADIIGLIPLAESISGTVFWTIAGVILWLKGYGLLNWKRLVTVGTSFVIGLVPGLQSVPQLTIGIIIVLSLVVLEDKTGISITKPLSGEVGLPKKAPPLNQGGVRAPR